MERPSPRLPGELTDEIIAWIADLGKRDPWAYYGTLLRCCLVCSQWLPASRYQLFPHLYIGSTQSYDLFVSQVLPQDSMRVYLSRVRVLNLANSEHELARRRSSIPFSYAFFGHLPNLTALHVSIGGVMTYLYRRPYTSLALSRFPSIRKLKLGGTDFPSFGDLRRTLTSLPNLAVLSMITCIRWPVPTAELPPLLTHGASTSSRPKLVAFHYLGISDADSKWVHQFLTWLASTSTGLSLRRLILAIEGSDPDPFEQWCGPTFLHSVARCVEELTLYVSAWTNGQSVW